MRASIFTINKPAAIFTIVDAVVHAEALARERSAKIAQYGIDDRTLINWY